MRSSSAKFEALAKELTTPLAGGGAGDALTVLSVSTSGENKLQVCVRVRPAPGDHETWRLLFDVDPQEFDGNSVETLWLIYRANIEEWSNCYRTDPHVRQWGTRIE